MYELLVQANKNEGKNYHHLEAYYEQTPPKTPLSPFLQFLHH